VAEGYIEKDTDPLILNNTYLPYLFDFGLSIEEIKEIKQYAQLKYQH
jgi:hypothetical protein